MTQLVFLILIRWKVMYPVDSAIQRFEQPCPGVNRRNHSSMGHDFDTRPRGIGVLLTDES